MRPVPAARPRPGAARGSIPGRAGREGRAPDERRFYDALAEHYEHWLEGDPTAELARDFYVGLLRGEGGLVLELGIGTGRVGADAAGRGARVVGIDISRAMLARMRSDGGVPTRVPLLVQGDMARLPFRGAFDLVVCPLRTVGHLPGAAALGSMLRGVYGALRPGGRFVFDLEAMDPEWAARLEAGPHLMYSARDSRGKRARVRVWNEFAWDPVQRCLHSSVRIERVLKGGRLQAAREEHCTIHSFGYEELRGAALSAGFAVTDCLGSFAGHPYEPGSPRMIWILSRPHRRGGTPDRAPFAAAQGPGQLSATTASSIEHGSTADPVRADS